MTPFLWALLVGCAKNDGVPAWAMDPVWIEPQVDGSIYGFQSWELFSTPWSRHFNDRFYVCSVVVEFEGQPGDGGEACTDCVASFAVSPSILETDCADGVAERAGFLDLRRVGIGPVPADLVAGDPYPGQSQGGYVDYGGGNWVTHGWAWPEALESRGMVEDASWNGLQPFTLWPAYVWSLDAAE